MIETLLTGGGAGAFICACAYGYQQLTAARRERVAEPRVAAASAVADAATANSLLLSSLGEEREEVQRLSGRVQELEERNAELYKKLHDQRRQYEAELDGLRRQMDGMQSKLTDLQNRLRSGD